MEATMYTVIFRCYPNYTKRGFPCRRERATLEAALECGFAENEPFDVHLPSGAIAWSWEMREEDVEPDDFASERDQDRQFSEYLERRAESYGRDYPEDW